MNTLSERFEMRLDAGTLERIDAWREEREPRPSRSEAVRSLVEEGLDRAGQPVLTGGERLIVHMLCGLFEALEIDGELDPAFIADALHGGHYWALAEVYSGIFHGHAVSDAVVLEVKKMLEMWSMIERGHDALSPEARTKLAGQTGRKSVRFPGFDGNHECEHMSAARFLIDRMGLFAHFAGRGDLNSHWPMLDAYRRMLDEYEPMRRGLIGRELNAAELAAILA